MSVSLFLVALSVFYYKSMVCRCAQLWPYIGLGWLGTSLHRDCNAMGKAAKNSPRVPSTCAQNEILSLLIIRDCEAMRDSSKISFRVPCTFAQNAILSFQIIHIIPSREIYIAVDNRSLVPSVCCLTSSSYLWNYIRTAYDVSHAENFQTKGYRCFPHWYKVRDWI